MTKSLVMIVMASVLCGCDTVGGLVFGSVPTSVPAADYITSVDTTPPAAVTLIGYREQDVEAGVQINIPVQPNLQANSALEPTKRTFTKEELEEVRRLRSGRFLRDVHATVSPYLKVNLEGLKLAANPKGWDRAEVIAKYAYCLNPTSCVEVRGRVDYAVGDTPSGQLTVRLNF